MQVLLVTVPVGLNMLVYKIQTLIINTGVDILVQAPTVSKIDILPQNSAIACAGNTKDVHHY